MYMHNVFKCDKGGYYIKTWSVAPFKILEILNVYRYSFHTILHEKRTFRYGAPTCMVWDMLENCIKDLSNFKKGKYLK